MFNDTEIPIEVFDLSTLPSNASDYKMSPSIVMIAKRGSGKSVVCKALLHHFRDIPIGIIISPTDNLNKDYESFFPKAFIHTEYKSSILARLFARQKRIIAKNTERIKNGKAPIDIRALLVMDDCLADKGSWVKDPLFRALMMNGRHYGITFMITMQFSLGIPPELRSNFDYVFLLADDTCSNQKRLYEHYAGIFPDFYSFREIFSGLTEDHGCMVIANKAGVKKNIFEKIFTYTAPYEKLKNTNIQFGCKQFRDYDKHNFNPDWESKKDEINIDDFFMRKKKEKSHIKIKKIDKNDKDDKQRH